MFLTKAEQDLKHPIVSFLEGSLAIPSFPCSLKSRLTIIFSVLKWRGWITRSSRTPAQRQFWASFTNHYKFQGGEVYITHPRSEQTNLNKIIHLLPVFHCGAANKPLLVLDPIVAYTTR